MSVWQETILELRVVRLLAALLLCGRGVTYLIRQRRHRALDDFCRVVRLNTRGISHALALRYVLRSADGARSEPNRVLTDYLRDPASEACARVFSLSGTGKHDLFRDLIVLKAWSPAEKGVILLKYARTFSAVAALFDLALLRERYIFVLEPCWAGYCDPSLLMFLSASDPVFVQCFTEDDFQYVQRVGFPLAPIRLGPADWVDGEVFRIVPSEAKTYDLVMVANWAARKRHALLFQAVSKIADRQIRVLLIGFPWFSRTADDIRREAARWSNPRVSVDILESLPHRQLAECLARCKAFVFLSRKEGDNKALVEAMFADLPVIVYDKSVGGARSRVNSETGILTSENDLADSIKYMLDHRARFSPRRWALQHTGSEVSTRVLDAALRAAVTKGGGLYTKSIVEKTNAPNLAYKDPARRIEFQADYEFIVSCLRVRRRAAVPEPAKVA